MLFLFFIECGEGVETNFIKTAYSSAVGMFYIIFENVKVLVENLFGCEGDGFKFIMYNFNYECWMIVVGMNGAMRNVFKECYTFVY